MSLFGWKKKSHTAESVNESALASEHENNFDDGEYQSENAESEIQNRKTFTRNIIFDTAVIPSEYEKSSVLKGFSEMRADSTFCDVSFLCQGVLFRAHRVIVSSWSRWLKALLMDGDDQEVVPLDMFHPDAF